MVLSKVLRPRPASPGFLKLDADKQIPTSYSSAAPLSAKPP
jgi:hypothetical protein